MSTEMDGGVEYGEFGVCTVLLFLEVIWLAGTGCLKKSIIDKS